MVYDTTPRTMRNAKATPFQRTRQKGIDPAQSIIQG